MAQQQRNKKLEAAKALQDTALWQANLTSTNAQAQLKERAVEQDGRVRKAETARKQAEEQLRASKTTIQGLNEAIHASGARVVVLWSVCTCYAWASRAYRRRWRGSSRSPPS